MYIHAEMTTLRFYVEDGWTPKKIKAYLSKENYEVSDRTLLGYYAVYTNEGHQAFKPELLEEHEIVNPFRMNIDFYIAKPKSISIFKK